LELARTYLSKHSAGDSLVQEVPEKGLKYIVVIPAYLETGLEESLVSLFNADPPSFPVEIIVLINWPDDESTDNINISRNVTASATSWAHHHSSANKKFFIAEAGFIPRKKAGVGYARKKGMDEAVRRFLSAGQNDGIILSFDADTRCERNYFTEIEEHFTQNVATTGCSVYFEHPLEGKEYGPEVYQAILQYELHMRYYLHSVRATGFPNAYYTVGSAFAVRAGDYCRQGGMNVRQAGEDFYFLQKFFDLGSFSDLVATKLIPSPRPSLRVPFGTGKAIVQLIKSNKTLLSYHPAAFEMLADFFEILPELYKNGVTSLRGLHSCLLQFLENSGFYLEFEDIISNSGSYESFRKRFYRYFNMFRILKFAKHAGKEFPGRHIDECAGSIMEKTGMRMWPGMTGKDMLLEFRKKDRESTDRR